MDSFVWALMVMAGLWWLKNRDDRQRIALLGSQLVHYQIEKLMEQLTQGYLRALGETDPDRRAQIWSTLQGAEQQLAEQFARFSADMARLPTDRTRMRRVPLPYADRWWPGAPLDLRALLQVHAKGLREVADNAERRPLKANAHMLLAEMLLMQHTCHWFCKSQTVASARLLARHRTSHEQVLQAVSAGTGRDYQALLEGRSPQASR